jgi:hypothetical protein
MPSLEAKRMIDMDLQQRCAVGEHQEDMTIQPAGVSYEDAPAVGSLWANPADASAAAMSSPHHTRAARSPATLPWPRKRVRSSRSTGSPRSIPFPAAVEDTTAAYRWLLGQGYDPRRLVIAGDSTGRADGRHAAQPARPGAPPAGRRRPDLALGRPHLQW